MATENHVVKPINNKVVAVQNYLFNTLNSVSELSEDWIKRQRYENASELRLIRLQLERIKLEFEQLAKETT